MSIAIEEISLDDERVVFAEVKPEGWAGYVSVEDFHKALEAEGVPEDLWPAKPTNNKRLERAIKAQKDSRRVLIRPLARSKGWSLVTEDDNSLELEGQERHKTAHSVDLTCVVKTVNNSAYVECTPWDHVRAGGVKQSFVSYEHIFKCSEDLSQWFSRTIIPWCRGVATRSRGGTYYVLKGDNLDRIKKVTKALETVSTTGEMPFIVSGKEIKVTSVQIGGRIILKPEVASETAVEILLDNFISECEQVAGGVSSKASDTNLGHRALSTQKETAGQQIDKLEALEDLLDTKLDKLKDKLGEAKDSAGMAALAALAKREEERNRD